MASAKSGNVELDVRMRIARDPWRHHTPQATPGHYRSTARPYGHRSSSRHRHLADDCLRDRPLDLRLILRAQHLAADHRPRCNCEQYTARRFSRLCIVAIALGVSRLIRFFREHVDASLQCGNLLNSVIAPQKKSHPGLRQPGNTSCKKLFAVFSFTARSVNCRECICKV